MAKIIGGRFNKAIRKKTLDVGQGVEKVQYRNMGELAFGDIPGFCFVVNARDLDKALLCIQRNSMPGNVFKLINFNRGALNTIYGRLSHEVYTIKQGEDVLSVIAPPSDDRETIGRFCKAFDQSSIAVVCADLYVERSAKGIQSLRCDTFSPHSVYTGACETEAEIWEAAFQKRLVENEFLGLKQELD